MSWAAVPSGQMLVDRRACVGRRGAESARLAGACRSHVHVPRLRGAFDPRAAHTRQFKCGSRSWPAKGSTRAPRLSSHRRSCPVSSTVALICCEPSAASSTSWSSASGVSVSSCPTPSHARRRSRMRWLPPNPRAPSASHRSMSNDSMPEGLSSSSARSMRCSASVRTLPCPWTHARRSRPSN